MARRRTKKRTHVGAKNPANAVQAQTQGRALIRDPKSMVIRINAGEIGSSVSQLVADVRHVMEPGTAVRLKERRANRLRDYVTMAGPLGVTHLLLFSRSPSGNTNLRVALTPRGPTMHFRVERYSLCRDVQKAQKHPRGAGKEHMTPPLLVMNNFSSPTANDKAKVPSHLESLVTTVFQSLFTPINPTVTPLKSIRRVLLLNREVNKPTEAIDSSFVLNFRHYAITTRATNISRPLRLLNAAERLLAAKTNRKGRVPNLGKLEDIADYMVGGENGDGYMTDATSGSEFDTDAEVEILDTAPKKLVYTAKPASAPSGDQEDIHNNTEKRAVKLVELGPRMRLRLLKVEEGLCSGKVMWHDYVQKTKEEVKELDTRWDARRREKEERRRQQQENVERKRKERSENGHSPNAEEEDELGSDVDMDEDEFDSDGLEGDAELQVNEEMEDAGEWEDEEIGNG